MKHMSWRASRAFTLIELLVVILILGILLAVAAPSFLSQTGKAQDSVTEQQLAVSRKEAKAIYTSAGQVGFPALGDINTAGSVLGQLHASEPQYTYVSGGTATDGTGSGAGVGTIDVTEPNTNTLTFCEQSASGTFFCFADQEAGGLTVPTAYHDGSLLDAIFGVSTAQAAHHLGCRVLHRRHRGGGPLRARGRAGQRLPGLRLRLGRRPIHQGLHPRPVLHQLDQPRVGLGIRRDQLPQR